MVPSSAMAGSPAYLTGSLSDVVFFFAAFMLLIRHQASCAWRKLTRISLGEGDTSRGSLQHSLGPDRQPASGPRLGVQREARGYTVQRRMGGGAPGVCESRDRISSSGTDREMAPSAP